MGDRAASPEPDYDSLHHRGAGGQRVLRRRHPEADRRELYPGGLDDHGQKAPGKADLRKTVASRREPDNSTVLRTFDFVDELQKISCPTLVLAGTHDWICPPAQAKVIAERIPRAHLKIFQHSAHSIAVDEPAAFQAAVTGFLTCAAS